MELILITPGYSLLNHFPPSLLHLFAGSLSFSFHYAPLVSLCLLFLLFLKTKKKFIQSMYVSACSPPPISQCCTWTLRTGTVANAYVPGAKRRALVHCLGSPMGNPHGYSR